MLSIPVYAVAAVTEGPTLFRTYMFSHGLPTAAAATTDRHTSSPLATSQLTHGRIGQHNHIRKPHVPLAGWRRNFLSSQGADDPSRQTVIVLILFNGIMCVSCTLGWFGRDDYDEDAGCADMSIIVNGIGCLRMCVDNQTCLHPSFKPSFVILDLR